MKQKIGLVIVMIVLVLFADGFLLSATPDAAPSVSHIEECNPAPAGDDHCYILVEDSVMRSWNYAVDYVLNNFGSSHYMVTITSATENGFVTNLLESNASQSTRAWIGLNATDSSCSNYTWQNDEAFVYANWASLEPNLCLTQKCGSLDTSGEWRTEECALILTRYWIVEYEPCETPVVESPEIAASSGNIQLAWADGGNANIYRSGNDPYFTPDTAYSQDQSSPWTDAGAAGMTGINYTYVIRATGSCGESADSKRLGEFDFLISPGS